MVHTPLTFESDVVIGLSLWKSTLRGAHTIRKDRGMVHTPPENAVVSPQDAEVVGSGLLSIPNEPSDRGGGSGTRRRSRDVTKSVD